MQLNSWNSLKHVVIANSEKHLKSLEFIITKPQISCLTLDPSFENNHSSFRFSKNDTKNSIFLGFINQILKIKHLPHDQRIFPSLTAPSCVSECCGDSGYFVSRP